MVNKFVRAMTYVMVTLIGLACFISMWLGGTVGAVLGLIGVIFLYWKTNTCEYLD